MLSRKTGDRWLVAVWNLGLATGELTAGSSSYPYNSHQMQIRTVHSCRYRWDRHAQAIDPMMHPAKTMAYHRRQTPQVASSLAYLTKQHSADALQGAVAEAFRGVPFRAAGHALPGLENALQGFDYLAWRDVGVRISNDMGSDQFPL